MKKLAKILDIDVNMTGGFLNLTLKLTYEDGTDGTIEVIDRETWSMYKLEHNARLTIYNTLLIILESLCIKSIKEVPGKYLWILGEVDGQGFRPTGIQPLGCDVRFSEPVLFSDIINKSSLSL